MTSLVVAVLVILAIGGPIAVWLGSQRRLDAIYVRHVVRGLVEAVDVLAPALRPPAPPAGWVLLRNGRIYAAGGGARDVSAAPAPAAPHNVVPAARLCPPRQARHAVVSPTLPLSGDTTAPHREVVA